MVFIGVWRSPVARVLWEHDAAGSNPVTPTKFRGFVRTKAAKYPYFAAFVTRNYFLI